ncbi:MAG: 16S rRNA (cytidine(1402)-2'-O)-methyltransferase [Chitinophagaceae bacterium]|nr:16S rRNA (cytidine(1402)-2'-O)-methyltransferase [Chitinophagaceae bacterium]
MLYIVPTPIGNLKDITLRALDIIRSADLILAEDTRTASVLLNHYEIRTPMTPYHQHNEHRITPHIVAQLKEGKSMALISDAGTPGISDPAYLLVRRCIEEGIQVETLPGATAFVPALINSGLPTHRFCFEGFLPVKKGRQSLLKKLAEEERTMIFYESPHRLLRTLQDFIACFGESRLCCISRELSKMHEENFRGSLKEAFTYFNSKTIKGEIVVVVKGKQE